MAINRPALAIPQTDPRAGYLAQRTAIDAAIARVLAGGVYILGREVEVFEAAFADSMGVAHAIGVASGTDAIEIALRACGIGSGDLVFTVSHTAVATIAAIERAGASVFFVPAVEGTTAHAKANAQLHVYAVSNLDQVLRILKRLGGNVPANPKAVPVQAAP